MTIASPSPKLGLALGSGAARGLAHIGVLKVLDEAKIPVDIITGTSIGALIGAMYAAGVPVAQMEDVALTIDWRKMASLLKPVLPTSSLTDSRKLVAFIAELLPAREFKDLQQTLAVTATDINTGEAIIIKQGDLLEALQASLAFPGIFSPVRFGQRFLVDGGLCNPINQRCPESRSRKDYRRLHNPCGQETNTGNVSSRQARRRNKHQPLEKALQCPHHRTSLPFCPWPGTRNAP